jgi:GxxExxY protein
MDTNGDKLLLKQDVFQIVGSAIEVLNTLGNGLIEKPYENALVVEFVCERFHFGSSLRSMSSTKDTRLDCSFRT